MFEVSNHQENPSKSINPGPTAATCAASIRLTNISTTTQTVKRRLRDVSFSFGIPVSHQNGLTSWDSNQDGIELQISEDRGAVLSNSTDPIEQKINEPMNGARPF